MKILELRFKNLNSLYGEWFIDFTDPEYVSNGIFALTGPTGAGKSTILDAICLALYGTTPRLGKITKSGNEIMSRQTGECYAEVMFQSQAGKFLCHWGQHRARKKADGKLADAKHEISDVETGKPIETKKSLVLGVIEEKTGMDFDRFTRSILLAQGGFDVFLKADVEQKSKILEQITGTAIYSEISRRVHERQRNEREKLNILQAETSGIIILEPEQEKVLQKDLEDKQKQEAELTAKKNDAGKSILWLKGIETLQKEAQSLSKEFEQLETELESFKPDKEKLSKSLQASELEGEYSSLSAIRNQQKTDRKSLKADEDKLPKLETSFKQCAGSLEKAEKQTLEVKTNLKEEAPLIQKVRLLDQKLSDQQKVIEEAESDCKKDLEKIESDRKLKMEVQSKRDKEQKNVKAVVKYLNKHSQDEWLVSGLTGIEEQLTQLSSKRKEIEKLIDEKLKATTSLNKTGKKQKKQEKQLQKRKQELADSIKKLEIGKKDLKTILDDRLLREYRTEKDTLLREMAFLTKISELEDHRSKLEDGVPCPLCGAKEHPYAEGNIPQSDEIETKIEKLSELIHKAEDQETIIKNLESKEKDAQKNLSECEKLEAALASEIKAIEKQITNLSDNLQSFEADFEDLKKSVLGKLKPLGIAKITESEVSTLLKTLQKRLKDWQSNIDKKSEIETQISDFDSELKRLEAVIETQKQVLSGKQASLKLVKKEYEFKQAERQELFGSKNPDTEEKRLNQAITKAEDMEKQERKNFTEAQQVLNSTKSNITSTKDRIEKRSPEITKQEANFSKTLEKAGFSDEKRFFEARLETSEREKLKLKSKELDDKKTALIARKKDRESHLSIEKEKEITDQKLDELEPQFKALEENQNELKDFIAGIKHQLSENILAKERLKEKQTLIETQKSECNRWEKLHGLIGSADGKKYRNFAQGLTFELMVSHANHQLEKMTDRYLLIRDDKQPLELNVIDNYQAGEMRSTKNLSGGESFIVSLTLALGLSKMASRKVRVDSLFLDEGFGTLDEDALETALETLSGLQQDGKIIGVISHVSALKERIRTQISILPVSGGKSKIEGPGCNQI